MKTSKESGMTLLDANKFIQGRPIMNNRPTKRAVLNIHVRGCGIARAAVL